MSAQCYLDESDQANRGIFSVGGFVLEPTVRIQFDFEWRSVLVKYGIKELHISPLFSRRGEFVEWDSDRTDGLLREVADLLRTVHARPVGAAVDLVAWRELTGREPELIKGHTPYSLAVVALFSHVARMLEHNEQVDFVLDNVPRGRGKGLIMDEFSETLRQARMESGWKSKLGKLTWEDSASTLPLQAADFAAYEYARTVALPTILDRGDPEVRVSSLLAFMRPKEDAIIPRLFHRKEIRRILRQVKQGGGIYRKGRGTSSSGSVGSVKR